VLALALVLFAIGLAVWWLERRRNPEQFGGSALQGVGSGFWWSAVTMTTVGYGDKAPATFGGRLVALVWMFASLILVSGFTAAIASALTLSGLEGSIRGPEDLPRVRVGSVADTTSADFLRRRGIRFIAHESPGEALSALSQGRLDAVVYDKPILRYLARTEIGPDIRMLPHTLDQQQYAIALPEGSPLREELNRALLAVIDGPDWRETLAAHLGE
jgi:ABC-type amino acid transport substrate-binding protein